MYYLTATNRMYSEVTKTFVSSCPGALSCPTKLQITAP